MLNFVPCDKKRGWLALLSIDIFVLSCIKRKFNIFLMLFFKFMFIYINKWLAKLLMKKD